MLKKELAELLKDMKDEDSIDEALKKAEPVKAFINSGLTLEAFKSKINDPTFKSYIDSLNDTHFNKALETWKTNHLDEFIQNEYYKKHPDDKKDPTAIELEKLKKQLEDSENARKLEIAKASISKKLTEKKLPIELAERIADLDETKSNENFVFYEKLFKEHDKGLKKDFVDHNMYIPGGNGDEGSGNSSVDFAKKLAGNTQTNKGLEEARESYFK